ncbi:MAG: tetratricopeptide repeat protein [Pyrinomonadaceae bacterium]|nr:tetratricopeptide repeat protein [Pyrinomonadaceae bacterium]
MSSATTNSEIYNSEIINEIIEFVGDSKDKIFELKNLNVKDSTIINNVTISLSKSLEYADLIESRNELEEALPFIPESNSIKRLELQAKIHHKKEVIKKYVEDTLRFANELNRIDINTERLSRVKEFFEAGKITEARAVFQTGLEQMTNENEKLIDEKKRFEEEILPKLKHNSEEFLLFALATQTDYKNPNRFIDTCQYFERSISVFPNKTNVFNYAEFLFSHSRINEAEFYYQKYLDDFKNDLTPFEYASALNNFANLHKGKKENNRALKEYQKAIDIYRQLVSQDSEDYEEQLARTLNNLANLNTVNKNYEPAANEFDEALEIRERLSNDGSLRHLSDLAETLNNVGNFYQEQGLLEQSLIKYNETIEIHEQLIGNRSLQYLSAYSMTLNNKAAVCDKLADKTKKIEFRNQALDCYQKGVEINRQLIKDNPQEFSLNLAITLNNLGNLQRDFDENEKALSSYEEALEITHTLAALAPQTFGINVAQNCYNLAFFYQSKIMNREKSVNYAFEALSYLYPIFNVSSEVQPFVKDLCELLNEWRVSNEEIQMFIQKNQK